eukprot:4166212-Pleurochrysis_carterae.AAC.1
MKQQTVHCASQCAMCEYCGDACLDFSGWRFSSSRFAARFTPLDWMLQTITPVSIRLTIFERSGWR